MFLLTYVNPIYFQLHYSWKIISGHFKFTCTLAQHYYSIIFDDGPVISNPYYMYFELSFDSPEDLKKWGSTVIWKYLSLQCFDSLFFFIKWQLQCFFQMHLGLLFKFYGLRMEENNKHTGDLLSTHLINVLSKSATDFKPLTPGAFCQKTHFRTFWTFSACSGCLLKKTLTQEQYTCTCTAKQHSFLSMDQNCVNNIFAWAYAEIKLSR